MATRLVLPIADPERAGQSWSVYVKETWDDVMNKVHPADGRQPSSALEFRQTMTFTTTDDRRITIPHGMITVIEEDVEPD